MIRSNNKDELVNFSQKYFDEILDFINNLPDIIKNTTYSNNELNERDKTVSDVVCHLYEWQIMFIDWYKIGMKGKIPEMPMAGYTWKQLNEVNKIIYEKYLGTDIKEAIKLFKNSHKKMMKILDGHSDNELFETIPYKWTGKTTLGRFFDANMSHHYQWGLKTLYRLRKVLKKQKINT